MIEFETVLAAEVAASKTTGRNHYALKRAGFKA
jgi:hypothetical protein